MLPVHEEVAMARRQQIFIGGGIAPGLLAERSGCRTSSQEVAGPATRGAQRTGGVAAARPAGRVRGSVRRA